MSNHKYNLSNAARKPIIPSCLVPVILLCLAPLLLGADSGCGVASSDFVVISDVHFNPFSDTSLFNRLVAEPAENWNEIFQTSSKTNLPGYGSESNYTLLSKALDSAASEAQSPVMVIFPGDILGHGFNTAFYNLYGSVAPAALKSFIYKTVRFFVLQIKSRFPNQPVFFTLGNNDAYAGDYNLVAGGDFLSETASLFMNQWLEGRVQADEFTSTYKAGGYYKVDSELENIRLISLNSVLFSTRRPAPASGDAAYVQLDWFENQLAAAKEAGQKVYVVTHVPPGVDVFQTVRTFMDANGRISGVSLMWHADYQKRFLEIMESYKDLDMVFFSGHTHMDEFRLLYDEARTSHPDPILGQPAVSPIFGNNPGYRLIHVSASTWQLEDYTTHYLPLDSADKFSLEYQFSRQYGLSPLDSSHMETLTDDLVAGGAAKTDYINFYYLKSNRSPITETNWPAYRCSTKYIRASAYQTSVNADAR
ncbi:metallophosphoesterase [Maridesulfovibrio sp.]|uniref:metallophosphoesterase n=1 Tax=Maridesulfovibrio sp. TaxID=2795000 RepID=UPI002A18AD7D|nr:metallophosphoesterase [Maridesulfovibrio sp.]